METRKRKAPSKKCHEKPKKEEGSKLDNLCKAAFQQNGSKTDRFPDPLKSRVPPTPTPLEIAAALRVGLEEDLKQEDEDAFREGRQPKIQFVELATENGGKVRLQKIPRAHRLPEKDQLERVMSVITMLVTARVTPTTKNIKLMGIGAG